MPNNANAFWGGIFFSLAAGMMWGLVFVGPLMLPEYPAALHTFGRYLAFGLIALPLAFVDRAEIKRLTRADWLTALKLAAIGNVLYYLFLSSAIQRAGGALPTMIIGTLPVVIAVAANLLNHQRDGRFSWLQLAPPLALILLGIACVNHVEWTTLLQNPQADTGCAATPTATPAFGPPHKAWPRCPWPCWAMPHSGFLASPRTTRCPCRSALARWNLSAS
jgi:drug/metabolite transporter (DMT)-like permease